MIHQQVTTHLVFVSTRVGQQHLRHIPFEQTHKTSEQAQHLRHLHIPRRGGLSRLPTDSLLKKHSTCAICTFQGGGGCHVFRQSALALLPVLSCPGWAGLGCGEALAGASSAAEACTVVQRPGGYLGRPLRRGYR